MREPGGASEASRTIGDYKSQRRHVEQVNWPGTEKPVWVLYLSVDEIQQATFAARVYFDTKAQRIDPANEVILDREIEYQMLQRMILRSEDPKAKLFPRVEDLRPALSVNECQYFMDEQERIKIAEWTSWFAELDHPALRQIARVLDLPMTTTPTELAEAVQGLRETAEALTEALK